MTVIKGGISKYHPKECQRTYQPQQVAGALYKSEILAALEESTYEKETGQKNQHDGPRHLCGERNCPT